MPMKAVVVTAVIAVLSGAAIRVGLGAQVMGPIMLLLLVALPIVGFFVTIDDELPGGFSNPDGKSRGSWRYWGNWADLAIRAALSGVGFAIDAGWRTQAAVFPWIAGLAAIAALAAMGKRIYRRSLSSASK